MIGDSAYHAKSECHMVKRDSTSVRTASPPVFWSAVCASRVGW